jgi:hypothetical protein
MIPTTEEVLREIGAAGVVVGSVARGKAHPKDLDVVVRPRGKAAKNSVFDRISRRWPKEVDSECIGHLTVRAAPLCVELFEHQYFRTGDAAKDACRVGFAKARRNSAWRMVYGATMQVLEVSNATAD